MFGSLGLPELIFIFVIALLLFGPRKLPQVGRSLGRALGEFRRASNELKRTIEEEVAADEIREVEHDLKASSRELKQSIQGLTSPAEGRAGAPADGDDAEPAGERPATPDREAE